MAMTKVRSVADVGKMDRGVVDVLFSRALAVVQADVEDRPAVKKARKITLEVAFTPVCSTQGTLETVQVETEVKTTTPVNRTRMVSMVLDDDGLKYNEVSPSDVRQGTIDQEMGTKKKGGEAA